jgi:diadenosine tetraphosphate (Ap4A) HIT family hydrolase
MSQCPFCDIVAGKVPARKIYEDDNTLVIHDLYPITPGHILVLTKKHFPLLTDIEPSDWSEVTMPFFKTVYAMARKMKRGLGCDDVTFLLRGRRIPHLHMHLIPGNRDKQNLLDLTLQLTDYCQPRFKPQADDAGLDAVVEKIKSAPVK